MGVPLIGSPPPLSPKAVRKQGGYIARPLLSDADSLASGSTVGHWVTIGSGSVTRASGTGADGWNTGIQALVVGSSADQTGAKLPGSTAFASDMTFKAHHRYQLVFAAQMTDPPTLAQTLSWSVRIGRIGVDATIISPNLFGFVGGDSDTGVWQYYGLYWEPTSDIAASLVDIEIRRNIGGSFEGGSHNFEIGYIQVFEAPAGLSARQASFITVPTWMGEYSIVLRGDSDSFQLRMRRSGGQSGANLAMGGSGQNPWGLSAWFHGIGGYDNGGDEAFMFGYAEHLPSDLSGAGIAFDAGVDYLGFQMSQKDADTVQFYADWSGGYTMELRDRGTNKGWVTTNAADTYSRRLLHESFQWTFHKTGGLTTATGVNEPAEYMQAAYAFVIDEVRVHVGTAPTGSTLLVDVNINGTTAFTTQANRPTIAISGTDATSGVADGGQAGAKNDRISFDIDQIGSTIAGSDLTVMVRGRYTH